MNKHLRRLILMPGALVIIGSASTVGLGFVSAATDDGTDTSSPSVTAAVDTTDTEETNFTATTAEAGNNKNPKSSY